MTFWTKFDFFLAVDVIDVNQARGSTNFNTFWAQIQVLF